MSNDSPSPHSFWSLFTEDEEAPPSASPFWSLFAQSPGAAAAPVEPKVPGALTFNPDWVYWGLRNVPATEAPKHFMICGTTGSGKTTAIELFLRSIAPRFQAGRQPPEQLILFDAKCDVMPLLAALGLRRDAGNVWLLNPIDRRSASWNLGEAIDSPVMARHLATLLVPEERHSSAPYFADAGREIVYAVLLALNRIAGEDWDLRDVLCALDSPAHIRAVTARHPRAKVLAERILEDTLHGSGVLSTLGSKLGRFEQVAALWHTNQPPKPFSLRKFLKTSGVLVLGNDPLLRESFWPINAILLRSLTQEILGRRNTLQPRHWFVLDEFRAMERVDSIHELLNRGRSKGASVLLGIQSVEGLLEIYGEHGANDILTQCAHKTFLRAGGPKTAEWAEKFFGQVRRTEAVHGEQRGPGGHSKSVQYALHERPLFLGSFFLDLPFPRAGEEFVAVHDVPWLKRILITRRPFDQLLAWNQKPDNLEDLEPSVERRTDPSEQTLQPWTRDEELFYCGHSTQPKEDRQSQNESRRRQRTQQKKAGAKLPSRDAL